MNIETFKYDYADECFGVPTDMNIRVVNLEGKPWFVAKDIAVTLGYVNTNQTITKFCKKLKSYKELTKGTESIPLHPATKLIPESDLYRLVMRSDMPEAERFQDWVCEEVLPTIRKTGGTYMSDDALAPMVTTRLPWPTQSTSTLISTSGATKRSRPWISDYLFWSRFGRAGLPPSIPHKRS